MPFKKGQSGNPAGKPKGTKHTMTVFKEAVCTVYQDIGGDRSFAAWAKKNPTDFYKIAARLIPQELTGAGGAALSITINGERQ
jgi:hypothetical protein